MSMDEWNVFSGDKGAAESRLFERFLSYVFHELRTPLTVVHSYAQLGMDKLPSGPEFNNLRTIMGRMIQQSEKTVEMIEELLESVRVPLGRLFLDRTQIEIGQFLDDVLERLPEEARQRVKLQKSGEAVPVALDLARMERAFNLLILYLLEEQQGRELEQNIVISSGFEPEKNRLRVEIQGPGLIFTENEKKVLFDLYRPIRELEARYALAGPLDIGLFVAQGVINAHGGSLEFDEDLPGFWLELPPASDSKD